MKRMIQYQSNYFDLLYEFKKKSIKHDNRRWWKNMVLLSYG